MLTADVVIPNKLGLHARPASKLVRIAARAGCDVFLVKNGQRVNGKSILGVIMLEAEQGSTVTIEIPGETANEQSVLDDMVQLVRDGFGES